MRDIFEFLKGVNLRSSSSWLANQPNNELAMRNLRGQKMATPAGNDQTGRYVTYLPVCGNGETGRGALG
jgi:hypothetical protein